MEKLKYIINLEDSYDWGYNSKKWGTLTATSFYINVLLTQNIDDMGVFTDIEYISADSQSPTTVDYSILVDKLLTSGYTFPFMVNQTPYINGVVSYEDEVTLRLPFKLPSDYYNYQNLTITGITDTKYDDLRSYSQTNRYKVGFNMVTNNYLNYKNEVINGVSRIVSVDEPKVYVFDAINDSNLGTNNQQSGLLYKDFSGDTSITLINGAPKTLQLSRFSFIGEGQNETNSSLSALEKEEYLLGITSKPTVNDDVQIDRGVVSVMDKHLRLSEIKNLGQLNRYGNGYYKLTRI